MKQSEETEEYGSIEKYVRWFETAEDSTTTSRKNSERDADYYDGKQLTAEEVSILTKRKQPPVIINRIKPKVDFMLGEERKQRTDPKAFPRNPQVDEDAANAATDALRYVADLNVFNQTRSACYEDGIKYGAYGIEIIVEPSRKDPQDFNILLKRIAWDRMFWDPHSRAKDFSDAKYKGVVLWMDREDALVKFGKDKADILNSTLESVSKSDTFDDKPLDRWADPKRNRVRIVQIYFEQGGEWHYAYYTKSGFLKGPQKCPYIDENGQSECPLEFQSAFVDRDGNRYGQVRQWIDIQDEVNKRRSKGLHLLNTRQVIAEAGAVADVNAARQELAKPDGLVEVVPGMKFDIVPTADMAAGNLQMLAEAKNEIDAQGPNAALSGAEARDLSGRAISRLQQGSSTELFPLIDGLRAWQHRVYRQVWNRIKQYWTAEKWIRVTDDENNVKFVGLNRPSTMGEMMTKRAQKEGIAPEAVNEFLPQMGIDPNEPTIENNVAELDIDIILDDVPDTVTVQQEQFEQIVTIYPSVPPNIQPLAFEFLVEASSLRNKKQFLEKLRGGGEDPQKQAEMQAKQQEAEDIQKEAALTKIDRDRAAAMRDMAQAEATLNPPANAAQEMVMGEKMFMG